ncbi:Hypothetical protein GbCGDNIH3_7035 [Granulibacter bethesdensis]|uniref:Uncharacterized protein n=1 Tax=Granulibacter bethesdensis TaxID=364410 RepID=A0AAN0REH4_9PROT|nr:Hypothetical protein GbCGDNIH3_7035 [Granulibacter bethesdensis]
MSICARLILYLVILGSCAAPVGTISGGIVSMAPVSSAADHEHPHPHHHGTGDHPCPSPGACELQASLSRLIHAAAHR